MCALSAQKQFDLFEESFGSRLVWPENVVLPFEGYEPRAWDTLCHTPTKIHRLHPIAPHMHDECWGSDVRKQIAHIDLAPSDMISGGAFW